MDNSYIKDECKAFNSRLIEWRRVLHQIPETGIELPKTETTVRKILEELDLEFQADYRGPGIVALVKGKKASGPVVAIRADMDALEIEEEPGREYGSRHPGNMHACGHDAHMAIALGAAAFFSGHRNDFSGIIKIVFQPAEESVGGARKMIEAGALENPDVDMLLGLHIGGLWEELSSGQIGLSHQPVMAAADSFEFNIQAPGAHGAAPHKSPDPVLAAAMVISQLHTLVSREVDPVDAAVITIGQINGGQAGNIIPTKVAAKGTVRTLDERVRRHLEKKIGEVISYTARGYNCKHKYQYSPGVPPVKSDPNVADLVASCAEELLGTESVKWITRPSMAGEDISLFMEKVPGCFFGLGASNQAKGIRCVHHSPGFDIDEEIMWHGAAVFICAALRWLKNRK